MKIAFDHQIFTQRYGGISRYYTELSQNLLGLNQNVSIFAGANRNNQYLPSLPNNCAKFNHYPAKRKGLFMLANNYWVNKKIAQWQPDIVHQTYYLKTSHPKKVAPTIVTAHDMVHELFPESFKSNDKTTERKRKAFANADHIISVSHNTKQDLIGLFGINPEKISVVYLAAQTPKIIEKANQSIQEKPFLLYVGTRAKYKNFLGFLRAVASSQKLINQFDIVAFGGGSFSNEQLETIKSLNFKENQIRQVTGDDGVLARMYSSATAFIYPSLYEGFGLPPLEAMAYECPVISSNTSSMPEVIGNAAEFFDPNNIESMTSAIENIVFSPSRIMTLKKQGLVRVQEFSWKQCAQETLGIYKKLT